MSEIVNSGGAFGASKLRQVILASSAGTLIEWYDFYLFGSLSAVLTTAFFPKDNTAASFLSTLAIFATGFIVRPFGAIIFGRLGDVAGRKYTFLLTLVLMGGSTCAIGLLPKFSQIGLVAPLLLLVLRLIQGLALGGEYGGAATYVAEHSPDERRGFYTSFIQTTASLGLFVSLAVILVTQQSMTKEQFTDYGWRIPFLCSSVLILFSYVIRRKMNESPLFAKAKAEGKTSVNPINESFGNPANRRIVLIALFGATAGQGVVWYTGQFQALFFLQKVVNVDLKTSYFIIALALLLGTPFFVIFGHLSDKIGRKKIMMMGLLLAAISYIPIYFAMGAAANYNPAFPKAVSVAPNFPVLVGLVWIQVIFVTMVYGPIAAFLVELFPTRIRYTSMSLPYHIGNGVFGGLVPFIGQIMFDKTKNLSAGAWYPIGIAIVTLIVGTILLPDLRKVKLDTADDRPATA